MIVAALTEAGGVKRNRDDEIGEPPIRRSFQVVPQPFPRRLGRRPESAVFDRVDEIAHGTLEMPEGVHILDPRLGPQADARAPERDVVVVQPGSTAQAGGAQERIADSEAIAAGEAARGKKEVEKRSDGGENEASNAAAPANAVIVRASGPGSRPADRCRAGSPLH